MKALLYFIRSSALLIILLIPGGITKAQDSTVVEFRVDVSALKNINNIGVRGDISPLSWEKTIMLKDENSDGIYEGTLRFPSEIKFLQYKYVYVDKTLTWELTAQNRILMLDKKHIQTNDVWNVQNTFDASKLPQISAIHLQEDFQVLKKALLEIHPGLYRYNTKQQIDSIFKHYELIFSKPRTYQESFLYFTALTSAIKCGHTFPSFYNQTGFIQEVVLNQKDKLPFAFRVIDQKIIVTESISNVYEIPTGTEIIAIADIPTKILLDETAKLVKADGSNDGKRYADLNTFGVGGYYEMFDAYFPLLHPPQNNEYVIRIKKPNTNISEELTVKTVTRKERSDALLKKNPKHIVTADQLWNLEFWENNTAYLQLGTFDVFQLSFEWSDFLKNAFREIRKRKTEHLVIDIRWNEGGQDEVLLFIGQNIAKGPLLIPQRKDLVRYTKISEEIKPYLFTWDNSFFDLSNRTTPFNSDYFTFNGNDLQELQTSKNAFQGQTYLLINGSNSSATFYFAEIAKENKMATLIGEPTGGSQKGLNASTMFFLRLPHSTIEIDIPIIGSFSEDKPAEGIQPDILVQPTLDALLKGEDEAILAVKELINQH